MDTTLLSAMESADAAGEGERQITAPARRQLFAMGTQTPAVRSMDVRGRAAQAHNAPASHLLVTASLILMIVATTLNVFGLRGYRIIALQTQAQAVPALLTKVPV